jgi:hypothetical protein
MEINSDRGLTVVERGWEGGREGENARVGVLAVGTL